MSSRISAEDLTERNQGEEITELGDAAASPREDISEVGTLLKSQEKKPGISIYSLIDNPERFLVDLKTAMKPHYPNDEVALKQIFGDLVFALPNAKVDNVKVTDGYFPREHIAQELWKTYKLDSRTKLPFEISTDELRFILSVDLLKSIKLNENGKVIRDVNVPNNTTTAADGGFGVVIAAYDLKMDKEVVVKILNHSKMEQLPDITFFLKEASLLAHLVDIEQQANLSVRSPRALNLGFLPVHTPDKVLPFIVMDRMPGTLLRDEIISTREALDIGDRLAEYIDVMNANGIYHLDVKPANILYERETNSLALLDWGIVRGGYRGTIMDRVNDLYNHDDPPRGTPNYVSPEEVNNTPSEFSNQHQLAVTIFNVMNGQQKTLWTENTSDIADKDPSAIADSMRELMHSDDTQYLPKPEWMSEDVHQVFLKATSYIPEQRYNSCQEFMAELRKAFDKRT